MTAEREVRVTPADKIVALSAAITAMGVYLPWADNGLLASQIVHPLTVYGVVPERAVLLVPIGIYAVARVAGRDAMQPYLLAGSSTLVVLYVPYRFSKAAFRFAQPADGFYLAQIGAMMLLAAGVARLYEIHDTT